MRTILLLFFLFSSNVFADDEIIANCYITPEIYHGYKIPQHFDTSNNLRRITGSPSVAEGKLIHISGYITDENCAPIHNATVSMWHVNAYGKYQYDKVDYKQPEIDKNFIGTGTAVTNNLGYYNFITIFPGEYTNKEPFIDFAINHPDFVPFETRAFFSNRNEQLKKFDPEIAGRLVVNMQPDDQYEFNITLSGTNLYRQY